MKNVSSALSSDGSPAILLTHNGQTIETLPVLQAKDEHRSFIISTWVRSYEAQARRHGIRDFYDKHEGPLAERLWPSVLVASDSEGFTVHAWVCGSEGRLWHCYVVPELRRLRIATRLIELATGGLKEYARPWPYSAHAPVNPYLLGGI